MQSAATACLLFDAYKAVSCHHLPYSLNAKPHDAVGAFTNVEILGEIDILLLFLRDACSISNSRKFQFTDT